MDHDPTETSAGAPQVPVGRAGRSVFVPAPIDEATPAPPAHLGDDRDRGGSDGGGRRRRWVLPLVLVPLLLVVITVIAWALDTNAGNRSEERCVGKECVSTCISRLSPYT